MAECKDIMDKKLQRLEDASGVDVENFAGRVADMVLPSVSSLLESSNHDTSNTVQFLAGKDNTAFSGCNFNITNIYGGDNGALQKSFVSEVDSSCPSLPDSEPCHEAEESYSEAAGTNSSSPCPKWTKSNEEMVLRVVPFATEMEEDWDDDLILVVWICWDDDKTFQNIVTAEHGGGNVTLDSYDTIILQRPAQESSFFGSSITIHVDSNEEYSWMPRQRTKSIQSSQVWNAERAKCSFRLGKSMEYPESQLIYITLYISQDGVRTDTKFILKKRISEIRMAKGEKRQLLQLLDTKISVPNFSSGDGQDKSSTTCWAIPYIDKLFSVDDDVIVTLWLCWYDKRGKILEALKDEQKLYARELLDTENSFVLTSPEKHITTQLTHNGYSDDLDHQKVIEALRIRRGIRAKVQFVSKRIEGSHEYAKRISHQVKDKDLSDLKKKLVSGKSTKIRGASNLLPDVKPSKLDIEISTWQEDQYPVEFRKVTEISRFLCGGMKKADKRRVSLGLKSCIKRAFRSLTFWRDYDIPDELFDINLDYDIPDELFNISPVSGGVVLGARYGASWDAVLGARYADGVHMSHLYHGLDSVHAAMRASMFIQAPEQHVLRTFICASQEDDSGDSLNLHVILVTVSSNVHKNFSLDEVKDWVPVDSYDTFLLTSQVCGCYDPLIQVTFEADQMSHFQPELPKMVIDVEEVLKEGIVTCSCTFNAVTDSQRNFFHGIVRITQAFGRNEEKVQFIIRRKMGEIEKLLKEESSTTFQHLINPSVWNSEDADGGVMLHEYQTCMIIPYVDLMQNIDDDIILTVWLCSIQKSRSDFNVLCTDQDKFMKTQLDTENSFVLFDTTYPVEVEVEHVYGQHRTGSATKKVDPRRIKDGGRAKFLFTCKRSMLKNNWLNVDITIQQLYCNEVQFMTRKKVEAFLQEDCLTKIQDTGSTELVA